MNRSILNLVRRLAVLAMLAVAGDAHGQVVALGAGITAGTGVGERAAYPARLESLLQSLGYNVQVTNAGVDGDTTMGMLARLDDAVPDGTKVVILAAGEGINNDPQSGESRRQANADIDAMVSRLQARQIAVIPAAGAFANQTSAGLNEYLQPDGIQLTAQGQGLVAARLLPEVMAVLQASG
jgi:acyl-CoA thioesterase-1